MLAHVWWTLERSMAVVSPAFTLVFGGATQDDVKPPLRPLDYLPLKNNVRHAHGSLAAHAQVTVFARAPGDVKSIGSPRRRRNTRTSCLNTNAHRPLLIALVCGGSATKGASKGQ